MPASTLPAPAQPGAKNVDKLTELLASIKGDVAATIEGQKKFESDIKGLVEGKSSTEAIVKAIQDRQNELQQKLDEVIRARLTGIPGLADETKKRKFSLLRACAGVAFGHTDPKVWGDGFERSIMNEAAAYRAKTMGSETDSLGGYIVPNEYMTDIIELLRAEAVVIKAGARLMDGLTGAPVEMPRQDGGATAYWVGENIAITASDLSFGQLTMTPHQLSAMTKLSQRLVRLSNPSAEALIRQDFAQVLALKLDLAALRGTGSSNEPLGIANTSGINTVAIGTDGGALAWDHLVDMIGEIEDDNALRGSLAFIMHPKIKRRMKQIKVWQFSGQGTSDTTLGMPLFAPILSDAQLAEQAGYPFFGTTQIPVNLTKGSGTNLSEVYFGNWAELLIAQWFGMQIEASTQAGDSTGGAFAQNQVWIKAVQEVDIAVRHAQSFCLINDADTDLKHGG